MTERLRRSLFAWPRLPGRADLRWRDPRRPDTPDQLDRAVTG